MARLREALAPPDETRVVRLQWATESYRRELERAAAADRAPAQAEPQLQAAQEATTHFLSALDAVIQRHARLTADEELVELDPWATLRELEAASLEVTTTHARTLALAAAVQSALDLSRLQRARQWLFVVAVLWLPLAAWLTVRPMRRIWLAARGLGEEAPGLSPERAIVARLQSLVLSLRALDERLAERTREAARAAMVARRSERELALFRLYNDNLTNSLRSAVVATDGNGQITAYNRPAGLLLSLDDTWVGRTMAEHGLYLALQSRRGQLRSELDQAMSQRQALKFESLPLAAQDHLVDLSIAPYFDESGAARGLLWICDDVTEAIRMRNQLLDAERLAAVGRLSAQVAHEIRNPLSAVGLNTELLEEEFAALLPGERRDEAIAILRQTGAEVERLTVITEGYLKLARMPPPERQPCDLNQLVGDMATLVDQELRVHGIELQLLLASPAPRALVDPGQIRQALLNIVRNSREAMSAGGRLIVRTICAERAQICVEDTGPGIPKELLARVFEPFFSTKDGGTGLGLSLTQQIVLDHGGHITVDSAPGRTTVVVWLPVL